MKRPRTILHSPHLIRNSRVVRRHAYFAFLRGFSPRQCCVKVLRLAANLCAVMVGSGTRWTDGAQGNAIYRKGPQRRADYAHLCATPPPGLPAFPSMTNPRSIPKTNWPWLPPGHTTSGAIERVNAITRCRACPTRRSPGCMRNEGTASRPPTANC